MLKIDGGEKEKNINIAMFITEAIYLTIAQHFSNQSHENL